MLTTATATLIRRYYDDIANEGDEVRRTASADDLLTPDFVFHAPNDVDGQPGLERHKSWQVWHHTVAPDQVFTLDDCVADEVRGAARWTVRATHSADFLGIPATGRVFAMMGVDYFLFRGSQIGELWRAFDLRELVRQLTAPDQ